ncbi:MAG: ArsR/SmtB family transcription factor [Candidatus Hodarchaeales archaeon]|jgi:predicted transcriptional regulator
MKVNTKDRQTFFDIIGNECRRKILRLLVLEPHYVSQLSKLMNKSQPAILKHMKILEEKELVIRHKESASGLDKGPDRHYFSINKSFCVIYSLSPHNVRELAFDTTTSLDTNTEFMKSVKKSINEKAQVAGKISTINNEIEKINQEMSSLERTYVEFEQKRNKLLAMADGIIEESEELVKPENYVERQLLRRHVCESQSCVKEISNLLNKKENEIQLALEDLRKKEYISS